MLVETLGWVLPKLLYLGRKKKKKAQVPEVRLGGTRVLTTGAPSGPSDPGVGAPARLPEAAAPSD